MAQISSSGLASTFDDASVRLRQVLGKLEEAKLVSPETLERIDFVSYPRTDCPPPHDVERHAVYNRLVLLALAEASLASAELSLGQAKAGEAKLLKPAKAKK